MKLKAALFDLDGVITDTAKVHFQAWKETFDSFLREHYSKLSKEFIPFSKEDYLKFVDGKPRYKGSEDFLKSREINLAYGDSDNLSEKTICGLGNKKNRLYLNKLKKTKPFVYESSISLIKELKRKRIKVAIVSSSKNAKQILNSCNLTNLFDVVVDGTDIEKRNLFGKPDPGTFIYATEKLKVFPGESVIFEDAVSGIEAGFFGNFGMVVGVSRIKSDNLNKADKVVTDLKEISFRDIEKWFEKGINESGWNLKYLDYDPQNEKLREALTATGNGYLCTRGCYETQTNSPYHYPGFYIAGIYNELTSRVHEKTSKNNNLVNLPNWLIIKIKIKNEFVNPFESEILDYEKVLNMKQAILTNKITFKDKEGRITRLEIKRFASMDNPHINSMNFTITPLNYSEKIVVYSGIDGDIKNDNVERYRELKSKHLKTISTKKISQGILLNTKTNNSGYEISFAVKNNPVKRKIKMNKRVSKNENSIFNEFSFKAKKNESYSFEKIMCVFTSRESKNPSKDSKFLLKKTPNFEKLFDNHKKVWKALWKKAGIYIEGDRFSQRVLRLHVYHLLISYSQHVKNLNVGLTARGLHGEAYRGRTFWDEIYILPFYVHRFPDIAKASLMYRYNRLKQAKKNAEENGFKGAMFPWQSSDTGKEETPKIHYNPRDKLWGPDYSQYQRHISIAVFYNFYKYLTHTQDREFLFNYAAEVMIEIARFWASIAKYNKKTKKYHILGVMGPDEFHEKYPKSKKPGLNDNAYTNVMTSWLFKKTLELCKELPEKIIEKLNVKNEEIEEWKNIRKNLYIPMKKDLILQFEGFDKLKELNWKYYIKKYKNISRLDRILKSEGKSPDDYKVLKQADVLMIFYLLNFEEAIDILRQLGVKIKDPKKFVEKNYYYYLSRTTHGSNLSKFVHGTIAVNLGHEKSSVWNLFYESFELDIYDTQGGTTHEGIHTALMAGTIGVLRKYIVGVKTHPEGLSLSSWIIDSWKKIQFRLVHQNLWYNFLSNYENGKHFLEITLERGSGNSHIYFKNKKIDLQKNKTKKIKLD